MLNSVDRKQTNAYSCTDIAEGLNKFMVSVYICKGHYHNREKIKWDYFRKFQR